MHRPLIALLVVTMLAPPPARADAPAAPWLVGVEEEIERIRALFAVPGMAVAVVHEDRVLLARGFGVRRSGAPEPVDGDTQFAIASQTKAFTATLLAMAEREGALSLDDRVVDRLPWLQLSDPWVTREVRLRDLLSHGAGYDTWAGDLVAWGSTYSAEEVLRRMRHLPPGGQGFRRYGYNNWTFTAAALALREATGRSWEEQLSARLLRPLRMARTTVGRPAASYGADVASPHVLTAGAWSPVDHVDLRSYAAAGGMYSSAADLARWLRAQLAMGRVDGVQVIPPEAIAATRKATRVVDISETARRLYPEMRFLGYGLGWFLRDHRGRYLVQHAGEIDGFFSRCVMLPDQGLGVVVLTNSETDAPVAIAMTVVDRFLQVPAPEREAWVRRLHREWEADAVKGPDAEEGLFPPRQPQVEASVRPEACAGVYRNPLLGDARIDRDGEGLRIDLPWRPGLQGPLQHWNRDTFRARWRAGGMMKASPVTFVTDSTGKVTELRLRVHPNVDPLEYAFTRVESPGGAARGAR